MADLGIENRLVRPRSLAIASQSRLHPLAVFAESPLSLLSATPLRWPSFKSTATTLFCFAYWCLQNPNSRRRSLVPAKAKPFLSVLILVTFSRSFSIVYRDYCNKIKVMFSLIL
ncbi:hypothetical protein BT93_C1548 [Corymbia citriodora subsp. variegata]|nr:hypothetical protein BT93_C1548 [Corymbia citriodora subsp. variegata]